MKTNKYQILSVSDYFAKFAHLRVRLPGKPCPIRKIFKFFKCHFPRMEATSVFDKI